MHARWLFTCLVFPLATACGGGSGGSTSGDVPLADPGANLGGGGDPGAAGGTGNLGTPTVGDSGAPDTGAPVDLGPGGDFRGDADRAADALWRMFDPGTGLFPSTGWWNSANAITALAEHDVSTAGAAHFGDYATAFSKNSSKSFLNDYYDDEGWWALAWIKVFDLTHDAKYLAMAKTIFADMTGGWDTKCNGGIWWSKARGYKNAIANSLFLEVAVRLHQRTPEGGNAAGSFLDWATREWKWFDASGMINGESLVNDGLDAACVTNKGQTWTYNQGVLIGGLVDLAAVTGDASLLTRAGAVARAATSKLVGANGVLREPCGASCSGGDVPQFKGVLMRHLAELEEKTGDPGLRAFLATNADWVWNAGRGAGDQLGFDWSGPFDSGDAARQASALDALNAALPFGDPQPNLALHAGATSNSACASDQGAPFGVDGALDTKWCAGATNGDYWLAIDLGATKSVGRVILRHAGAGGENAAWNTRDFTLEVSTDGKTWSTVAAIRGNTLPVTIHRFAPTQARHVRLSITAAQTDPNTLAARIYELEAYAR